MTNHAARGSRAENQVRDELGAMGYDVIRSAASKGAADLVAVHDGEVLFVQVKLRAPGGPLYTQPSPAERRELVRVARRANGFPVAVTVAPGSGSRPVAFNWWLLTGTGPQEREMWLPRDSRTEMPTATEPGPRGKERPLALVTYPRLGGGI